MNTLDRAVNNDILRVSKSLLPYLHMDQQRPVAILIKAMELIYTINLYSKEDFVRSMTRSQDTGWEKDFLNDVKTNLSSDKAYFIDAILKLTEAKDLLNTRHSSDNSAQNPPTYSLHESDSGILEEMPFEAPASPKVSQASSSNTSNNSPNPTQIIDKLSPLLEPSQVQLLKLLSGLMK